MPAASASASPAVASHSRGPGAPARCARQPAGASPGAIAAATREKVATNAGSDR